MSQTDAAVFLGTRPNEWWTGHDTFDGTIETNMKADVKGISLVAEDSVAYSEGTVGRVADRFKLKLPDGKEASLRLTAVFRWEDGDWDIVLSPLST